MKSQYLNLFYYTLYDASLFLGALSLLVRWGWAHRSIPDQGRFWTGVLATKLILASFVPMIASFASLHQPGVYLAITALLSSASIFALRKRLLDGTGSDHFLGGHLLGSRSAVLIFCGIMLAFLPVLLTTITPPSETDSLTNLSKLLEWVQDKKTPYHFAYNYVSFAEAAYVPILVLARQDTLLWLPSLQAVLLFGLAAYQLAHLMFSSRALALVLALNGTAFFHLWFGVSGVATIKNDMLYNAGVLLVVLASLSDCEADQAFLTRVLFVCGFTFASVKYSGPVFLAGLVGILVVARWLRLKRHLKPLLIWTAPVFLATTGHFYIKNFVLHANPLFPMRLSIFGWSLPGTMDFQGTSILANWNRLETWGALLGTLKEGFLFPFAFLCLFCFLPILFVSRQDSEPGQRLPLLAAMSVLSWLVFLASQWTAGMAPGDLGIIAAHYSLRYASAADVLAKIVFCSCLIRFLSRSFWVVFGVVAGDLLYRLFLLYQVPLRQAPPLRLMCWATAILVLLMLVMFFLMNRGRTAVAGIIPLALIAASPVIGEINRSRWWINEFKPVTDPLRRSHNMEVVVVESLALWPLLYPASGQYFQHRVLVQNEKILLERLADCRNKPNAVVLFSTGRIPDELLDRLTRALYGCGVALVGMNGFSAAYFKCLVDDSLPLGPLAASFVPEAELREIESGQRGPVSGFLFTISNNSPTLLRKSPDGYRIVCGRVSNDVKVTNLGGQVDNGEFSSLEIAWTPLGWRITEESLEEVASNFTISSILESGRPSPRWILGGGGPVLIDVAGPSGEQVLRLRAGTDMPWLAAIFSGHTETRNSIITLYGELRSLSKGPGSVSISANGKYLNVVSVPELQRWTRFAVSQQIQIQGTEYQFAVGLGSVKSGDMLEIRSLRILRANLPTGFDGLYQRSDRE